MKSTLRLCISKKNHYLYINVKPVLMHLGFFLFFSKLDLI